MFSKKEEPRLLIPALKPFYDRVIPLSWVVVRFAVGWNFLSMPTSVLGADRWRWLRFSRRWDLCQGMSSLGRRF